MKTLRTQLIRLAHSNPDARKHLLPLLKEARLTEQGVYLEGVRPSNISTKDDFAHITVTGNTFPIKDKLAILGLRWNPADKSWGLSTAVQLDGFRKYDQIADKINRAFEVLQPLVAKLNQEINARNKALSGAPAPRTPQQIVQRVDSINRRNQWLEDAGLKLKTVRGDALGVPEMILYMEGDTYPLVAVFKKFGFRWWSAKKLWWIPYSDWTLIEQKFLAMIAPWVRSHPAHNQPSTTQNTTQSAPTSYPWSKGPVWLRNPYHEDEAQDTGMVFKSLGPNFASVQTTYVFEDYERPPVRVTNAEAMKMYTRAVESGLLPD